MAEIEYLGESVAEDPKSNLQANIYGPSLDSEYYNVAVKHVGGFTDTNVIMCELSPENIKQLRGGDGSGISTCARIYELITVAAQNIDEIEFE